MDDFGFKISGMYFYKLNKINKLNTQFQDTTLVLGSKSSDNLISELVSLFNFWSLMCK